MNFLEVEAWKDQKKILHGFGTRNHSGDKITRKDWRGEKVVRWKKQLPLVSLHQVHKDGIVVFQGGEEEAREHWEREGDALITAYPGIAIGVFTADCLPVLLFEPEKQVVAAVHAGWRGTAQGVTGKVVEKLVEVFACATEKIRAALGPCIGPCCYEVDGPVEAAFHRGGLPWDAFVSSRGPGKWALDLQEANAYLLLKTGVKKENIRRLGYCTACRSDLFFSHRRESGTRGRHLNFIALF